MKGFGGLIILVFVGSAGWGMAQQMDQDTIAMAVGIFFGALAVIPVALIVLAASRRREEGGYDGGSRGYAQRGYDQPRYDVQPYYGGRQQHYGRHPSAGSGRRTESIEGYHPMLPPVIIVPPGQPPYQQPPNQAPPWAATGGGNMQWLPPGDDRFGYDG
jgi:hypothetical protein